MAVYIIDDPEKIELLADFTREEVLQLLNKYPMTETQLSEQLHLTKAGRRLSPTSVDGGGTDLRKES